MLRYHNIANDEGRILSLTSLTEQEFADLVPFFTTSFYEYLNEQTIDGYERIGRSYVAYRNSPLPTIEDKLLFILVYLKQAPTQEVQASLFGMRQPKANMWIHLLHEVLNHALEQHGDLPRRDILIKETDITPKARESEREEHTIEETIEQKSAKHTPFFFTMEQSGQ